MIFGDRQGFAIEAFHEPEGPEWKGFGRLCMHVEGVRVGDIAEQHVSLHHAADRFRDLCSNADVLWDDAFTGLDPTAVFHLIEDALYGTPTGSLEEAIAGMHRFGRFDLLTGTGEHSDGYQSFVYRDQGGMLRLLYRLPDGMPQHACFDKAEVLAPAAAFVRWLEATAGLTSE
ncbi:MAG TPA: hypothetical protein VF384_07355 [Planctomycetota bacterium]